MVSASASTVLGGVPRVCAPPSIACTAANGGTRTSTSRPGARSVSTPSSSLTTARSASRSCCGGVTSGTERARSSPCTTSSSVRVVTRSASRSGPRFANTTDVRRRPPRRATRRPPTTTRRAGRRACCGVRRRERARALGDLSGVARVLADVGGEAQRRGATGVEVRGREHADRPSQMARGRARSAVEHAGTVEHLRRQQVDPRAHGGPLGGEHLARRAARRRRHVSRNRRGKVDSCASRSSARVRSNSTDHGQRRAGTLAGHGAEPGRAHPTGRARVEESVDRTGADRSRPRAPSTRRTARRTGRGRRAGRPTPRDLRAAPSRRAPEPRPPSERSLAAVSTESREPASRTSASARSAARSTRGGLPPRCRCITCAHSEPPSSSRVSPSSTTTSPSAAKPFAVRRRRASSMTPSTPTTGVGRIGVSPVWL